MPRPRRIRDAIPRSSGEATREGSHGAATPLTSAMIGVALIDTAGIQGAPLPDVAIGSVVQALWTGFHAESRTSGHR